MSSGNKKYCLDTSGISTPLHQTPMDLYPTLWDEIKNRISDGVFAATHEIYQEMIDIDKPSKENKGKVKSLAEYIKEHKDHIMLEINKGDWPWNIYLEHVKRMEKEYEKFIAEKNKDRKGTIGMNDLSIIILGKTLNLPVVTMERAIIKPNENPSEAKRHIPDICHAEGIECLTFNDLLRREGIKI